MSIFKSDHDLIDDIDLIDDDLLQDEPITFSTGDDPSDGAWPTFPSWQSVVNHVPPPSMQPMVPPTNFGWQNHSYLSQQNLQPQLHGYHGSNLPPQGYNSYCFSPSYSGVPALAESSSYPSSNFDHWQVSTHNYHQEDHPSQHAKLPSSFSTVTKNKFCKNRECTSIVTPRVDGKARSPYCSNKCQTREQNLRQGRVRPNMHSICLKNTILILSQLSVPNLPMSVMPFLETVSEDETDPQRVAMTVLEWLKHQ
ncbi:hypothetical protein P9112_003127 [Eukaryota sp. TZLM1-RC]